MCLKGLSSENDIEGYFIEKSVPQDTTQATEQIPNSLNRVW